MGKTARTEVSKLTGQDKGIWCPLIYFSHFLFPLPPLPVWHFLPFLKYGADGLMVGLDGLSGLFQPW